jgi:hypothetical protein
MEAVKEVLDSNPERQCSSCNVIRNEILFWDIKGGKCFKTCEVCRNSKKKYREKKSLEVKESSIKSKSSSSSSPPPPDEYEYCCVESEHAFDNWKIIECCGIDIAWDVKDEDALEMYMTRTGKHFTLKVGDTWGDIKEGIQSSAEAEQATSSSDEKRQHGEPALGG